MLPPVAAATARPGRHVDLRIPLPALLRGKRATAPPPTPTHFLPSLPPSLLRFSLARSNGWGPVVFLSREPGNASVSKSFPVLFFLIFFQDIAWLPQWLQPYGTPTVGDHRNTTTAVSSPSCQVLFLFSALIGSESVDSELLF